MPSLGSRPRLRWLACVPLLASLALAPTAAAAPPPADDPEVGYAREVSWHVDDLPELAAMEPTIRSVLAAVHTQYRAINDRLIEGFNPGANYSFIYIRDTATILPTARYYYGADALRSAVEQFLRLQYPDGAISATISPGLVVDKATATSDEETSGVLAAAAAYAALPEPAWLARAIDGQSVLGRLNRAMDWVLTARRDPGSQLIMRAHTTDWGDIKWEPSGDPAHLQPGEQWTVSIYDQAIAYAALRALARLNDAADRPDDARRWLDAAAALQSATNASLWQDAPERGYYRVHRHLDPDTVQHPFDEGEIVAIGNAAAVYYGLADPDKVPRILAALERARTAAGAPKVGLTLEPPYPRWREPQMDPRVYQNGALWDWWAGRQISGEFRSGYQTLAAQHLVELARDWATHPGQVREWESPWLNRVGTDQLYAGAAAVVGQAAVEGLFGVELAGNEVRLTPRLGDHAGGVRVYEPASDLYAAYRYRATADRETLVYGSNSPTALSVRLPLRWPDGATALLDGQELLPIVAERTGEDPVAVLTVPSGVHRVDLLRRRPGRGTL